MITYILFNKQNNKYYCGKTNNLERRLQEHAKERWKGYKLIYQCYGNWEKLIKNTGVEKFIRYNLNSVCRVEVKNAKI